MLARFCLYGFLKNQRYFEPVLVLALLERGLSFGQIGLLYGFRELIVAALEIPSGAIADVLGRRGALVLAVGAYIGSFVIFALATPVWALFAAMACYAIGDSFRSGTHKAMIFRWLETEGRTDEKTRVYGLTRSWSKLGSAAGVVLTGVLLATTGDYRLIFGLTLVPYVALLVNLLTYPASLESPARECADGSVSAVARHTWETLAIAVRRPRLRRLLGASMGFEGMFHACKDYLQPALAAIALGAAASSMKSLGDEVAVALVLTPVYFCLFVLAALGSRWSHVLAGGLGGETRASGVLWIAFGACFAVVLVSPLAVGVAAAFVALHVVQNLWRPMLITRFDDAGEESRGATILSVESQARRVSTMVLAPVLGFLVDVASASTDDPELWPIGAVGLAIALVAIVGGRGAPRRAPRDPADVHKTTPDRA